MDNLTEKQREVMRYLSDFIGENGYSPTLQQIADNFGWTSRTAAQNHLHALERKDKVFKTPRGYQPK